MTQNVRTESMVLGKIKSGIINHFKVNVSLSECLPRAWTECRLPEDPLLLMTTVFVIQGSALQKILSVPEILKWCLFLGFPIKLTTALHCYEWYSDFNRWLFMLLHASLPSFMLHWKLSQPNCGHCWKFPCQWWHCFLFGASGGFTYTLTYKRAIGNSLSVGATPWLFFSDYHQNWIEASGCWELLGAHIASFIMWLSHKIIRLYFTRRHPTLPLPSSIRRKLLSG